MTSQRHLFRRSVMMLKRPLLGRSIALYLNLYLKLSLRSVVVPDTLQRSIMFRRSIMVRRRMLQHRTFRLSVTVRSMVEQLFCRCIPMV
jgi:hypothetical protein